jgi:hypothetical protein
MAGNGPNSQVNTLRLIAIPALITFAITIIRLMGEMQGWSKVWFNPEPGGGAAPIGIVWLVLIFGAYFGVKLTTAGDGPSSNGRVISFALLGVGVLVVGFVMAFMLSKPGLPLAQTIIGIASIAAIFLQRAAWPSLFKALVAYGFAARIPVTIIMFFAIRGNWGTHYDGPPPGFPEGVPWFTKFLLIGAMPQLVVWIAFTVVVGTLLAGIAVAVTNRGKQARTAQA